MDSNQILSDEKDRQVLLVLKMCPTNPKWQTAAILKIFEKLSYLRNRLTDFDEIWHSDSSGASTPGRLLKFTEFEILKWRTAAILINGKIDISLQPFDLF